MVHLAELRAVAGAEPRQLRANLLSPGLWLISSDGLLRSQTFYRDWAFSDERIVGWDPWPLHANPAQGATTSMSLGLADMPEVLAWYKGLGEEIVSGRDSRGRSAQIGVVETDGGSAGAELSSTTPACGKLPAVAGFSCYPGFCASDHHAAPPPRCGPAMAGLKLNGSVASRLSQAKAWCDSNSSCAGFTIDPAFASLGFFSDTNFTRAAQPNAQWTAYWRGPKQPYPPPPPPPPPPPWHSLFPSGPCTSNTSCSLNGDCVNGDCVCSSSWTGDHCQHLALKPLPAGPSGYGVAPNVSSWGGSIFHNDSEPASLYHLYVTEEADGKGLSSWRTASQIVHAVSTSPLGPYTRRDVVSVHRLCLMACWLESAAVRAALSDQACVRTGPADHEPTNSLRQQL